MIQFIQKHIGCFVLVVVLLALIAPRILTLPGAEWFDLTQTGEIGDTIGGTTAPFWGFLNIILLYLTLKEQQRFNKDQQKFNEDQRKFNEEQLRFNEVQQMASDYDILIKLRDNISELSNNLTVAICSQTGGRRTPYQGSFYIEELRKITHPENAIEEGDFDLLYRNCMEIAELILLFFSQLTQSPQENGIKRALFHSVTIHSKRICSLFDLTNHKSITIISNVSSIEDDISGRYKSTNGKYLNLMEEAHRKLQKEIGIN